MNACEHKWETVTPRLIRCKQCGAEVSGACCPEKDRRLAELEKRLAELTKEQET